MMTRKTKQVATFGIARLLALAAVLGAPGAALACRVASFQTPILHEKLPALPADAVAAEVEVVTDVRAPPGWRAMDVRIIRMIRGQYRGRTIRIEPKAYSSCDGWPYPGTRGIVVGSVLSSSDEALVVDPIRAPSAEDLRRQAASRPGPAEKR
jgi:hypothetical protein